MTIFFKDNEVIDENDKILLLFDEIENIPLYKFINYLVENENNINLVIDSKEPISVKLFEIINEEFTSKTSSSWDF